ncbi:hypothetical protein [Cellulomonas sp. URHE0023]|uniref:hypothetical protein n=1 Tax=Cellulomonas sp. URHE0023 TaxID=1380354 RepID=UPI000483DB40|nr:hypothetical protein [Cellulomonas sp. URHE0023]
MAHTPAVRRHLVRGFAVAALAVTATGGVLATSASAATSPTYATKATCLSIQGSYELHGGVRITRSCYGVVPQVLPGVWDINKTVYRFDYVSR